MSSVNEMSKLSALATLQAQSALRLLEEYPNAITFGKDYLEPTAGPGALNKRQEDFHRSNQYLIVEILLRQEIQKRSIADLHAKIDSIGQHLSSTSQREEELISSIQALVRSAKGKDDQTSNGVSIGLLRTDVGNLSQKIDALVDKIERNPDEPWIREIATKINTNIDLKPVQEEMVKVKQAIGRLRTDGKESPLPEFGTTKGTIKHDWTMVPYQKK